MKKYYIIVVILILVLGPSNLTPFITKDYSVFRRIRNNAVPWDTNLAERYQKVEPARSLLEAQLTGMAGVLHFPSNLDLSDYHHFNRLAEVIFALGNSNDVPTDGVLSIIKLAATLFNVEVNAETDFVNLVNYKNFLFKLYDDIIRNLIYAFQGETDRLPDGINRDITLLAESQLKNLNSPIIPTIEHLYDAEYRNAYLKQAKLLWLSYNNKKEDPVNFLVTILNQGHERTQETFEIPTTEMEYLLPTIEAAKGLQIRGDERAIASLASFNFRSDEHYGHIHSSRYNQLFNAVIGALDSIAERLKLKNYDMLNLSTYIRNKGSAIVRIGGGKFYKVIEFRLTFPATPMVLMALDGNNIAMTVDDFKGLWDKHIWDKYSDIFSFPR